jgi:hypothetical protein
MTQDPQTLRIRELNDAFRAECLFDDGFKTGGIHALSKQTQRCIFQAVQDFDAFTPDNDPHGEHDFGSVTVEDHKVFWKIDYLSPDLHGDSEDPSDPTVTFRIITIMLAHEY